MICLRYILTYSQTCETSINLQLTKQGIFSIIPEAAVHMNLAMNIARFFRTPILHTRNNHMLYKIGVLKILANSLEITCAEVSIL